MMFRLPYQPNLYANGGYCAFIYRIFASVIVVKTHKYHSQLVFCALIRLSGTPGVSVTKLFTNYLSFSTSTVSWLPRCSRWPLAHLWSSQPVESIQKRRQPPSLGSHRRHPQPLHPLPEEHGGCRRPAPGNLHKGNQIRPLGKVFNVVILKEL